jgi:hypothetical protein
MVAIAGAFVFFVGAVGFAASFPKVESWPRCLDVATGVLGVQNMCVGIWMML